LKSNAVPLLFHHVPVKFARKLPMKRSPHASPSKQFVKPRVIFEHAYASGMSSPAATTSSTTTSSLPNYEGLQFASQKNDGHINKKSYKNLQAIFVFYQPAVL
jgi:hypothetical protein